MWLELAVEVAGEVAVERADGVAADVTAAFFGATGSRLARRGRGGLVEKLGDMNEADRSVPREAPTGGRSEVQLARARFPKLLSTSLWR